MCGPRRLVATVALAGCQFEHGTRPADARDVDVTVPDAIVDAAADAAAVGPCAPDPALVACYRFEGNGGDESGNGLHLSTQNVTFVAGKVGMAMQHGSTSAADVGEDARLDVGAVTLEAWVYATQMPSSGGRAAILDNHAQWGLFVHDNGRLQCTMIGGPSNQVPADIETNAWTHVACTYDGSATRIYVDGKLEWTGTGGGTLNTSGSTGLSIAADNPPGAGSRLVGLVDEVRIYSVARDAADICAAAGCSDDEDVAAPPVSSRAVR